MKGMKAKTIKGVLRKKIDKWINSISDESLKKDLREDTIVTGGCIASMLLGEKINDFDLYFKTKETVINVIKYYINEYCKLHKISEDDRKEIFQLEYDDEDPRVKLKVISTGAEGNKKDPEKANRDFKPVFFTSNAVTLSNKIQIVTRFYGDPDEIHANYDFAHCTSWWDCRTGHLELRPEALESLLSKDLIYRGSKYPLCSIIRIRKFIKRGWSINAGQILKMALQLNEFDLSDLEVLEDQLIGVDTAYFQSIINEIKIQRRKNEEDCMNNGKEFIDKISASYVVAIVDRVFG